MKFNNQQLGAVLAGLRLLQLALRTGQVKPNDDDIGDILTEGGAFDSLTIPEIDGLCEAINTEEVIDTMPIVVLEINGGLIHCARASAAVKLIILDEDIDGGDEDRIMSINDSEVYVTEFTLTDHKADGSSALDPEFVAGVVEQLTEVGQEAEEGVLGSTEFALTSRLIADVLTDHSLRVVNSRGKSFRVMASELLDEIDTDRVVAAAVKAGGDISSQTQGAYNEIKTILVEMGILDF